MNPSRIFSLRTPFQFEKAALEIFRIQAERNEVYKSYILQLGVNPEKVKSISQIPFLPIEFFKTHEVITRDQGPGTRGEIVFLSSGTTGMERSKHYVSDSSLYERSFRKCFELFYGDAKNYAILALLPSYYENKNSSLIYMMKELIMKSKNKHSAFYNHKDENIIRAIKTLLQKKNKVILFGVSFALLDCLPLEKGSRGGLIVIETGGMKGRNTPLHPLSRGEITREELHKTLCKKFGVKTIHSEYGMTELLSQAYSKGDGIFNCPPRMKVFVREVNDPFQFLPHGQTGALNIMDLANIHSCSFIATQDVGRTHKENSRNHRNKFGAGKFGTRFEVLGRLDNSDLRGCNLLAG